MDLNRENNPINQNEETNLDPLKYFNELKAKIKTKKISKTKLWQNLIEKYKDWIIQSLNEGLKKSEIYYIISDYVKKAYGRKFVIKPNYFYILLNKTLKDNKTIKEKSEKINQSASENKSEPVSQHKILEATTKEKETDQTKKPKKVSDDLDEFNEGGLF